MKRIIVLALGITTFISCKNNTDKTSELDNLKATTTNPTEVSKSADWRVLFDGSSFDNFKEYLKDEVSENWKIEDNAMVFYPPKDRKKGEAFNLVTKDTYTNFVLSLEWKIAEGGNSGIFWGIKENTSLSEAYQTGPEIQVLDNERHPDAKAGTTHQAGALYDMVAPSKDVTKPVGEWNTCVLTINHKKNQGSVVLNGEEILSFPVNDPEWSAMVAKSKFADWNYFGKYPTGKIGLQDHGDGVAFKNIKIKEL